MYIKNNPLDLGKFCFLYDRMQRRATTTDLLKLLFASNSALPLSVAVHKYDCVCGYWSRNTHLQNCKALEILQSVLMHF